MRHKQLIVVAIFLGLFAPELRAHGDTDKYIQLTSSQIISVFAGKTLHSVNERTKDKILTYLSRDGTLKQSIQSSNVQRNGWWHAADNQLCLRWQKDGPEHCFDKVVFHDEIFMLIKDDQVETIVNKGDEGDTTGF